MKKFKMMVINREVKGLDFEYYEGCSLDQDNYNEENVIIFSTLEEAKKTLSKFETVVRYLQSNNLVNVDEYMIQEIEVDEDGDEVEALDFIHFAEVTILQGR